MQAEIQAEIQARTRTRGEEEMNLHYACVVDANQVQVHVGAVTIISKLHQARETVERRL